VKLKETVNAGECRIKEDKERRGKSGRREWHADEQHSMAASLPAGEPPVTAEPRLSRLIHMISLDLRQDKPFGIETTLGTN
jgi:hypothetical protein